MITVTALRQGDQGIDVLPGQLAGCGQFSNSSFIDMFSRPITVWYYYPVNGEKPREIAMRVLRRRGESGDTSKSCSKMSWAKRSLNRWIRGLCQELVLWDCALAIDAGLAGRPQNRGPSAERHVAPFASSGLYQLFWLQRIPNHAAVHELSSWARSWGSGNKLGFERGPARLYPRTRCHGPGIGEFEANRSRAGIFPPSMAGRTMAGTLGLRQDHFNYCSGTTLRHPFTPVSTF